MKQVLLSGVLGEEVVLVSLVASSLGNLVVTLTTSEVVVVVVFSVERHRLLPVSFENTVTPYGLSVLSFVLCSSTMS